MILILSIITLIMLLGLGALFSAAETAMTALSRIDIIILKEQGSRGNKVAQLLEKPERLIASLLIGNNIANISASAILATMLNFYFGSLVIAIGTFFLTFFIIIFCEIAPKQYGLSHKYKVAKSLVGGVRFFYTLFSPILSFLLWFTSLMFFSSRRPKDDEDLEKSLKYMIELASQNKSIDQYERDFINNILDLNDRTARQIMIHRKDIFSIDGNEKLVDIYPQLADVTYSRIPVYEGSPERIVGILYPEDMRKLLLGHKLADAGIPSDLMELTVAQLIEPVAFLPDTVRISDLFFHFQQSDSNLVIILDEYGGLSGIISQEDVLEAVFGKLYDEGEQQENFVISKEGGSYTFAGMLSIQQFKQFFNLELEENSRLATVSGYLCDFTGVIPEQGEQIQTAYGLFTVRESDGKRIIALDFQPHELVEEPS